KPRPGAAQPNRKCERVWTLPAALVVQLLKPVEAVAAVAHHFTGLADIAELLGELQQANLGTDDLLFSRHGVLQCAERGDSPWGQDTSVRLSFGFCNGPGEVKSPN